ncbi:MAG: hypothetical protein CL675_11945 [Bdellovibrionaceae bacterium]|nr:hypothetical protein [Pseudobdellovibrionaceae bacterium]
MLQKLSLKELVIAVVIVPVIGYGVLATGVITSSWERLSKAKVLDEDFAIIDPISDLIHNSQIERGTSAVYLSGGTSLEVLETRRKKTDDFLEKVVSVSQAGSFDEGAKTRLRNLKTAYAGFRAKVAQGAGAGEVVTAYTGEIHFLMSLLVQAANNSPSVDVTAQYRDLLVLERAKENGGLFRAKLSSFISRNQPLSGDEVTALQRLRGGFETYLGGKLDSLSPEVRDIFEAILVTEHWKEVTRRHLVLLEKIGTGGFQLDGHETFGLVTKSINDVKSVIESQRHQIGNSIAASQRAFSTRLYVNLGMLGLASVVIVFMALVLIRRLDKSLGGVTEHLRKHVHELANIGSLVSLNSRNLNRGTSSVQAAVESTSSASHQIGELLESNKRLIVGAREGNELTQAKVADGLKSVQAMKTAMTHIEDMNVHVIDEVRKSQDSFKQLVDIIGKISEKTGVIDEIVFQTKLLAFNASVEAARAGEAGKGFAVVAEEIGSLATLSGNASSEIAGLLGESMTESKKMQSDLDLSMARIQEDSKKTVSDGVKQVDVVAEVLDQINAQSDGTSKSLDEFVVAFSEQTAGLEHIEKSVHELLNLNGETAEFAKKNVESAKRLNARNKDVQLGVRHLDELSRGRHMLPAGTFSVSDEKTTDAAGPTKEPAMGGLNQAA